MIHQTGPSSFIAAWASSDVHVPIVRRVLLAVNTGQHDQSVAMLPHMQQTVLPFLFLFISTHQLKGQHVYLLPNKCHQISDAIEMR